MTRILISARLLGPFLISLCLAKQTRFLANNWLFDPKYGQKRQIPKIDIQQIILYLYVKLKCTNFPEHTCLSAQRTNLCVWTIFQ